MDLTIDFSLSPRAVLSSVASHLSFTSCFNVTDANYVGILVFRSISILYLVCLK